MTESCKAPFQTILGEIQPSSACWVADTDAIWSSFETISYFGIKQGETYLVPYLSALYTPGYYYAAEDMISARLPFCAVGKSLPRLQLSLPEASMSWFAALWLPCTGDTEALLAGAWLAFYGLSPMEILCLLPYGKTCPPDMLAQATALAQRAGVRLPDLDVFILSSV